MVDYTFSKSVSSISCEMSRPDIVRYIGQVLLEPRTAGNLYRLLKEEILSLKQMPERYPYEDDERLRALGIRKLLVKNYKVNFDPVFYHRPNSASISRNTSSAGRVRPAAQSS